MVIAFLTQLICMHLIQWIDATLSKGNEVEFFHDEFRCPVYVKDVVNVIITLIKTWISGTDFVFSSGPFS